MQEELRCLPAVCMRPGLEAEVQRYRQENIALRRERDAALSEREYLRSEASAAIAWAVVGDYCDKHQPGHVYTGRWCVFCELEDTRRERDELADPGFDQFVRIARQWLTHYPPHVFTGTSGDSGPGFVQRIREAVERLEADKAKEG